MAELNLTPDKRGALTKLVRDTIAADPYPLPAGQLSQYAYAESLKPLWISA